MNRRDVLKSLTAITGIAASADIKENRIILAPKIEKVDLPVPEIQDMEIQPVRQHLSSSERFNFVHLELVDQPCFDSLELEPGRSSFSFFMIGIGQRDGSGQLKTWSKTSQYLAGMLPAPQMFHIDRMLFAFLKNGKIVGLFRDAIWTRSLLSLHIGLKSYWQGQPWMVAHPFCALNSPEKWKPENFDRLSANFDNKPTIQQQQFFQVRLDLDQPLEEPGWEAMCILDGTLTRPIM